MTSVNEILSSNIWFIHRWKDEKKNQEFFKTILKITDLWKHILINTTSFQSVSECWMSNRMSLTLQLGIEVKVDVNLSEIASLE